jgi:4-hydroxy-tetrahydrodipicolinate synthase
MAHGGHGCISVTANVAPKLCADLMDAALAGDFKTALGLQDRLIDLHINLFLETSPAPAKYALSLLGKCSPELRLPMVPVGDQTQKAVREALAAAGISHG